MSFRSQRGKLPIIERDSDPLLDLANVRGHKRGYYPRDWHREPFGSVGSGIPFPVIPRNEWTERIAERERNKARISDLLDRAGLTVKNQGQTNYCWINAPVHCLEIMRVVQGQEMVRLSPASAGAVITGFRNVGGWGSTGLEFLVHQGCVPEENWPANAIDRRYHTPDNNALRKLYRVTEWMELQPRDFDELMTCLLMGYPVAVGYNWWRHEVTAIDGFVVGRNSYGIVINNSWGLSWGDGKGRGVLTENSGKAIPDDAVAPRFVIVS